MLVAQSSQAARGDPTPTFQLPTQCCSGGAQQRKGRPLAALPCPGVRRGTAPVLPVLKHVEGPGAPVTHPELPELFVVSW